MSNTQLALIEPSPLELWKVQGGGLARVLRGLIPHAWASGFEQMMKYNALLAPYVGSHYAPDNVDAAIEDEALAASLNKASKAVSVIAEQHPLLSKIPMPLWTFLPWRALRDRALKKRVARSMQSMREVSDSVRTLEATGKLHSPISRAGAARDNVAWFVYDAAVPAEIAKRLLAGLRARVTMDLLQCARGQQLWTLDDMKRALTDWADATDSAMGLAASFPGISAPSLPQDLRFDLADVFQRHGQRRSRLAEDATSASHELTK